MLLRDGYHSMSSILTGQAEPAQTNETLMEYMVSDNSIGLGDPRYEAAKSAFTENYREILEVARARDIPLIICTLVSNERDLPPFVSFHGEHVRGQSRGEWDRLITQGAEFVRTSHYDSAIAVYKKALVIDSMPAITYFQLGTCYQSTGDSSLARTFFIRARDFDGLRFRAPTEFNGIIRRLALDYRVSLADIDSIFRLHSPHGSVGHELLLEHVHPNLDGYFLLAKTWFTTAANAGLLPGRNPALDDSAVWRLSDITDVDRAIGKIKVLKLTSRKPFRDVDTEFVFHPRTIAEEAALKYVVEKRLSWAEAHLYAAREFTKKAMFADALAECRSIEKVDDSNPFLFAAKGDIYSQMHSYEDALMNFAKSVQISDNPYARYRMGVLELLKQQPGEAITDLTRCIELSATTYFSFPSADRADARYNLAIAEIKLGRIQDAKRELELLLKENPSDNRAAMLLRRMAK